jgi:hypothetical protein
MHEFGTSRRRGEQSLVAAGIVYVQNFNQQIDATAGLYNE